MGYLNQWWMNQATSSNITSYWVGDAVTYAPTYVESPAPTPAKPKSAVEWLRSRIDEITTSAWTEVPA